MDITEINRNHPCANKNCQECETCIFDQNLFLEDNQNEEKMSNCTSCYDCENLIKNYINEVQFNACCGRYLVMYGNCSRPRIIKAKTGLMLPLMPPEWCPRNRGVTSMNVSSELIEEENNEKCLPSIVTPTENVNKVYKPMTYTEKREELMKLPQHLKWDEIEEGGIYVIPKILFQARKVVRVVMKNDTLLRCCEIDEFGKESQTLCSLYPKDIDVVFMTKVLKY